MDVAMKDGIIQPYPVKASTTIYQGMLVAVDATGYLIPCPANVGKTNRFIGVAADGTLAQGASDGAVKVPVFLMGLFHYACTGASVAKIGAPVYVTDNNTLTVTDPGDGKIVGHIVNYTTSGKAWVKFQTADSQACTAVKVLAVPIVKKTSEFDTGLKLPAGALVLDVYPVIGDAVAASTFSVGTLSSESGGDADGFIKTASGATAGGVDLNTVDDATAKLTIGALLYEAAIKSADTTALYYAARKPYYVGSAARAVSITTTDHAITGTVYITYVQTGLV